MAKKSNANIRRKSRSEIESTSVSDRFSSKMEGFHLDYKEILRELYTSPTVRYLAGGIAAAVLNRYANRLSEKYPEIADFLRENIDTFEGKLADLKHSLDTGSSSSEARH